MEPALLRAGRFDYVLELPLPTRDERREILALQTEGLPLAEDVNLGELADATGGWTGADLELVCKKAAILALEEYRTRPSDDLPGDRAAPGGRPGAGENHEVVPHRGGTREGR